MTGLDCNIFVQLALQEHPANTRTVAAVLHTAGVRRMMTSNPADFTVFGVFEIVSP